VAEVKDHCRKCVILNQDDKDRDSGCEIVVVENLRGFPKQTTRSGLWIDKKTSRVFSIFAVQRIDDYYRSTERILSLSPVKGISPICSRLIQVVVVYRTLQEVISS
jgi:hypothetical protein